MTDIMLTKLFSSNKINKTYKPTSPTSPIYTPNGFIAFQDVFPDEQLDQAYEQLKTTGVDGFIFKDQFLGGNLTLCIQKFAAHSNPIYLAAIFKYQGIAKAMSPRLVIDTVNYPRCLSVMGAYGIPLNKDIPGGQDTPSVPPPVVHAARQHNAASLQVLARYKAIHTAHDVHIFESIYAPGAVATKGNQENCIMIMSIICNEFTQNSGGRLAAILSHREINCGGGSSQAGLNNLIEKDCDRVLDYLIRCGLNLTMVYGPSGGTIIAARHRSIDCLKIMIAQHADLRLHETCAGSCLPFVIFIPMLWPCLIASRTSPLKEAQKGQHEACIKLIEAWLLAKKEGRLGHTKEELKAFVTNWEIAQNSTPIAVKSMELAT